MTRENKVVESASMQPDQKQQTLKSKYFRLILALVSNIFLLEFDVDQNRDDAKDIWTLEHASSIKVAKI